MTVRHEFPAQIAYFRPELIAAALRLKWNESDLNRFEQLRIVDEVPIRDHFTRDKFSALYREAERKTQDPATKQTLGIIAKALDLVKFSQEA